MAVLEIQNICATDLQLQIQVNNSVFIANSKDTSKSDTIWKKYNISLVEEGNDVLSPINIRPVNEFVIQSAVKNFNGENLQEYIPRNTNIVAILQSNNEIVGLTEPTSDKLITSNRYVQQEVSKIESSPIKLDWFSSEAALETTNSTSVSKIFPFTSTRYKVSSDEYYVVRDPDSNQLKYDYKNPTREIIRRYAMYSSLAFFSGRENSIVPEYAARGMRFNYITECNAEDSSNIPTYERAKVYLNSTSCKNEYDENWNCIVDAVNTISNEATPRQFVDSLDIRNCRTYTNIGIHSDHVWASYNHTISYLYKSPNIFYELVEDEYEKYLIEITVLENGQLETRRINYLLDGGEGELARIYTQQPAGYDFLRNIRGNAISIASVRLRPEFGIQQDYLKYEYAERIRGANKLQNLPLHKSNAFSIEIKNSGILTSDEISEDVKIKIRGSINNFIRSSIKRIIPSYTQLLDIYWSGS